MSDDLLKHLYEDQRKELDYRRTRENQIFTWSATVLLALIGGALVTKATENVLSRIGQTGVTAAIVLVFAFTAYTIYWLIHERRLIRAHQRVLARIAAKRGWFDEKQIDSEKPILPQEWRQLGTSTRERIGGIGKIAITCCLGLVAITMLWLLSRL